MLFVHLTLPHLFFERR